MVKMVMLHGGRRVYRRQGGRRLHHELVGVAPMVDVVTQGRYVQTKGLRTDRNSDQCTVTTVAKHIYVKVGRNQSIIICQVVVVAAAVVVVVLALVSNG